jgi:hypothetical protein
MNFKTTIVLIILLAIVGGVLWWTGRGPNPPEQTNQQPSVDQGTRLIDVQANSINALNVTNATGEKTALKKTGDSWRLTEPVAAPAVDWSTQDLVRSVAEVRSQGRPASAPDSGLDKPRYRIEISTDDGKTIDIAIGNRAGPDLMYAQVDGGDVNLIDSALDKTLKTAAQDLRDKHLLSVKDFDVKQFRLSFGDHHVAAAREAGKWKILEPSEMPGDESAISALLTAITGAEATQFLKSDTDELAFARFNQPTVTVWLSTDAPTTQPATTVPANPNGGLTLLVGASDSLANDHYFVQLPDGQSAKISKDTLEGMEKTGLDLRDKDLLNLTSDDVNLISIQKQTWPLPTTQPTSRAASQPAPTSQPTATKLVLLSHRPEQKLAELGPPAPTTQPTTGPTTGPTTMASVATKPATQPAIEQSLWQFGFPYDAKTMVDDSKVTALLGKFQPLHAEKYLEKAPDVPPVQAYTVVISPPTAKGAAKPATTVEFVMPSNGANPYGVYNGLTFEVSSQILDALNADFRKNPD